MSATATISKIAAAPDQKAALLEAVGNLDHIDILHNSILVATYIRPERTAGGIIRPTDNIKEDMYQGKVGLVLKKGPLAFKDDDINKFEGQNVEEGQWVGYRVGDTWMLNINEVPCRLIEDSNIRFVIDDPKAIF